MASVADQHCASCIGTLSFPIPRPVRDVLWGGYTEQSSQRLVAPTDRTVYTDVYTDSNVHSCCLYSCTLRLDYLASYIV